MTHTITLILGDGIGPEVTSAARRVVDASGVAVNWETHEAGEGAYEKHGTPLPEETLASISKNKIALKGPLTTPVGAGFRSINVALRKHFDLYINLRPARSHPNTRSKYDAIDLVVFRENTEDLYIGEERYLNEEKTAAESIARITQKGSERIARAAFAYAKKHGRKKITIIHKANILKFSNGLFLDTAREVAQAYPDIVCDDKIVDNMCMQLVIDPHQFDVILAPNMFGDIVSDLCAGLVGGLGFAAGANIGNDIAIFEAVHGSAPKYAGKNVANPSALILSACLMLRHLDEHKAADTIENALTEVLREKKCVTKDIDPDNPSGTKEMTDAIIEKITRASDRPS